MSIEKRNLVKVLKLDKCFRIYNESTKSKQEVLNKFISVWGESMAYHFLNKYDDAESLVWALDSQNLKLFIEKF